jgi:hypothetical protein
MYVALNIKLIIETKVTKLSQRGQNGAAIEPVKRAADLQNEQPKITRYSLITIGAGSN